MSCDDSIVKYDGAAGNIHMRTGKVFSIKNAGTKTWAMAEFDLPITVKFSCDQNDACIPAQGDATVGHARMSNRSAGIH
jgi:hypothetical protein